MWNQNGNKYQAVTISLNQPGTVTFDANLYYGSTCDPNSGQMDLVSPSLWEHFLTFSDSDFKNQMNMSALWKINNQTFRCINYMVA